jgi:hypothetical protein
MSSAKNSLSVRPKSFKNRETGSPFDYTDIDAIKRIPGSHQNVPSRDIDVSAFSLSKRTKKEVPDTFLKKGSGFGGALRTTKLADPRAEEKKESKLSRMSKKRKKTQSSAKMRRDNPPNTQLRRYYERGDLPLQIEHGTNLRLAWKVEIDKLDYHHYLPILFDGLREKENPYAVVAEQGAYDLMQAAPHKVRPVIPQLIIPIKTALNTRDPEIMVKALKILQALIVCDVTPDSPGKIGRTLVPYYRHILPVLNIFINSNSNLGDKIDYGQGSGGNIGDLINETLELLEIHGGRDAYLNLKYIIPTYQSVVHV